MKTRDVILSDGQQPKGALDLPPTDSTFAPHGYGLEFDTTLWPAGTLVPVQTWYSLDGGVTWRPGGAGTLGKASATARVPNKAFLSCSWSRITDGLVRIKATVNFPRALRTSCTLEFIV